MLDLAIHKDERAVSLADVASRQGISEKYLWQVVNPLKAAGIIQPVRGAFGGYRLAREPRELTIREIVSVLEGGLALTDCAEDLHACDQSSTCVVQKMWKRFSDTLAESMESVTLQDLVHQYQETHASQTLTYEI